MTLAERPGDEAERECGACQAQPEQRRERTEHAERTQRDPGEPGANAGHQRVAAEVRRGDPGRRGDGGGCVHVRGTCLK